MVPAKPLQANHLGEGNTDFKPPQGQQLAVRLSGVGTVLSRSSVDTQRGLAGHWLWWSTAELTQRHSALLRGNQPPSPVVARCAPSDTEGDGPESGASPARG